MNEIDEYLRKLVTRNGSDLHLIAGQPPRLRIYGELIPVRPDPLTRDETEELLVPIMSAQMHKNFDEHDSCDFAYAVEDVARFRVNIFRHLGGMGSVMHHQNRHHRSQVADLFGFYAGRLWRHGLPLYQITTAAPAVAGPTVLRNISNISRPSPSVLALRSACTGGRASNSATRTSSVPAVASSRTKSPSRSLAKGPPMAASGLT